MDDKAGFGVIVDKISFLDKISLLSKAISDNENPTPGYMYTEISKITFETGSHCHDLLVFLVDQLSSKSCHVRYKVLKILRFVAQNGHPEFKQGLRKRALGITESVQFSGPPDPLHGMANYLKVRQEAAALSEELFNVGETDEDSTRLPVKPEMPGMGSSGGKMLGFGNTPIKPKSLGENLVTSVKGLAEKVMSPPHSVPYLGSSHDKRFGDYQPVSIATTLTNDSPVQKAVTDASSEHTIQFVTNTTKGKTNRPTVRKKGVPGGGWADPEEENGDRSVSSGSSEHKLNHLAQNSVDTTNLIERLQEVKTEDWSTEENLVNDLVKEKESFHMSYAELKKFKKQCSMINCEHVVKTLNSKLQSTEENVQMRCMLLLEVLLRTDYVNADQVVHHCKESLASIYNTENEKSRAKARKILKILEKISS